MEIEKAPKGVEVLKRDIIEYIIFSLLLVLLILSESYNFLLFHTLAEIFSIIIAGGVFLIGWNSRKYMKNSFFLIVGISFLFVAIIDLFHTLAYTGLPIFVGYTSNLPTQLWIAARYIQASSILIAVLFLKKKVPSRLLIGVYSTMTFFLIFLIFQGFFPDCYVEGVGLTPFKIISEYVIILLLIISLIGLYEHRKEFNPRVLTLINLFIGAMIISEFSFTLYISTYGFANFVGHVFKIIAFFFVYKAIIEISLQEPYNLLFRKLKSSQEKAEEAYAETEQIFNASLPLRILNLACDIIKVNDTFCELFNVERSDILGKKCYNVMRHSHCDTDLCALNQITGGKNKAIYETNFDLDQNGQKEITVIINAVPYKSSEGELLGIIQNFIDITKRKKAEERLEQFISTASHELRTPITVLVHSMELLEKYKNEMTQEQIEEMLNRLPRNVSLLSELVEDLLLISRLN
ncbi:MAG: PAS domain-containing protein, partial [Promethearchaeota archaeon]